MSRPVQVILLLGLVIAGFVCASSDGQGDIPVHESGSEAGRAGESSTLLIRGLRWPDHVSADDPAVVSGIAFSSAALNNSTMRVQAGFHPLEWAGQLLGLSLSGGPGALDTCAAGASGTNCGSEVWDASEILAAQDWNLSRQILSHHFASRQGIAFRWDALSTEQQALLDREPWQAPATADGRGEDRLRFLRGDMANAGPAAPAFRQRRTPLGDIVNSEPVYVGAPLASYGKMEGYEAFRKAHATRPAMVYVGANDGMLHGFDAATGAERIAFVPGDRRVFAGLPLLARQDYPQQHRFFVDGFITVADARGDAGWRSLLVGGLRAGGQTIFALDVTDPDRFAESAAAEIVLWQFGDRDDADFGYSFGRPSIVKMQDGRFAVLMANGYFSAEADGHAGQGRACLFLLSVDGPGGDLRWDPGADYRKLCAPAGGAAASLYNGLSSAAAVDIDGDQLIDTVYAGDLEGQLWRFDVSSRNPAEWQLAYGGLPLFSACAGRCSPSTRQPISVRPEVGSHPLGAPSANGVLVYFGTGQDFMRDRGPLASATTQSLYMVYDPLWGTATATPAASPRLPLERSSLRRQEILRELATDGGSCRPGENCLRTISEHPVQLTPVDGSPVHRGWYLDLEKAGGGAAGRRGERVVADPQLRGRRISFTTAFPHIPGCRPCSEGWLMELDFRDGGRRSRQPPFDINADGRVDHDDRVITPEGGMVANGLFVSGRMPPQAAVLPLSLDLGAGGCQELRYQAVIDGGGVAALLQSCDYQSGRLSWRQIR